MNLYAEHGYIFILFLRTVNRHIHSRMLTCAFIYIELAVSDYSFFKRQKKKNPTFRTVFAFHTPLRATNNIKESATQHELDSTSIKSCGLF